MNRDPQAYRLQEMKDEIEALRGELSRARLSSKPSTVATTVDTSVMVEVCVYGCVCVRREGDYREFNLALSFPLSPCPVHKYMYHGWGVGGR